MKQKLRDFLKNIPGIKPAYFLACRLFLNRWRMRKMFRYDRARFLKFSPNSRFRTKEGALAGLIMTYHVVEKGLTMPDMRLGFGREMILGLVESLNEFADKYGTSEPQFIEAVRVIAEYKKIHDEAGFDLDEVRSRAISSLLARVPVEPSAQIEMTRERYWAALDAPFETFSVSRHSVRHFAGTVSEEQIRSAVALANNAPSACNRQYTRVHCVSDREKIRECLALQNGNRGFGHLADKLLILTADLRAVWGAERNDIFTNAGIYLMNLCYALHKNRVAHCMLNWSTPPLSDKKLRKLLPISEAETVIVFIACGDVPEKFKLASSPRKSVEETLVLH